MWNTCREHKRTHIAQFKTPLVSFAGFIKNSQHHTILVNMRFPYTLVALLWIRASWRSESPAKLSIMSSEPLELAEICKFMLPKWHLSSGQLYVTQYSIPWQRFLHNKYANTSMVTNAFNCHRLFTGLQPHLFRCGSLLRCSGGDPPRCSETK